MFHLAHKLLAIGVVLFVDYLNCYRHLFAKRVNAFCEICQTAIAFRFFVDISVEPSTWQRNGEYLTKSRLPPIPLVIGNNPRELFRKYISIKPVSTAIDGKDGEPKDDADRLTNLINTYLPVVAPVLVFLAKPEVFNFRQNFLALVCYFGKQFERFHKALLWTHSKLLQFILQLKA